MGFNSGFKGLIIAHITTWLLVPESLTDLLHLDFWHRLILFRPPSCTGGGGGIECLQTAFHLSRARALALTPLHSIIPFSFKIFSIPSSQVCQGRSLGLFPCDLTRRAVLVCHPEFLQHAHPVSAFLIMSSLRGEVFLIHAYCWVPGPNFWHQRYKHGGLAKLCGGARISSIIVIFSFESIRILQILFLVRSKVTITVNDLPLVVVRGVSTRCRNWMLCRFWLWFVHC